MTFRMTSRLPVQVWAPLFQVSPLDEAFSRDLQRAQREWRGEDRIWLMPGAKRVDRWVVGKEGDFSECLVPSEEMNLMSVIYVDEDRRLFPPLRLPDDCQNALPKGLYRKWLNATPAFVKGPASVPLAVPVVADDRVSYVEETF
ncbi:MAG: hypothetical protein GTN93_34545, partial [Anaerolineae bacterium]|nr:hypothetical protein [Anaerolineae bacterium]